MFLQDYKKDFIEVLIGCRVVILAHQDVDSVCAVRILTNLFKSQGIPYILLSCSGIIDLKAKYAEYSKQSEIFILINCGGTVDLLETLGKPPVEKKFFILDYHRPIHILNYYNSTDQIKIVAVLEEDESVPQFDDVFQEEPDDDSDTDVEDDPQSRRGNSRRKHQEWLYRREKILFKYRELCYYARPSSFYAQEIAWIMNRDHLESLWCASVALTDSFVMGRLSRAKYTEYASSLNDLVIRSMNSAGNLPRTCLKLRFERELFLFLYRSWSVYESAKVTPYLANTLRTWSEKGQRAFHQLLVQGGLPLTEVKQKWINMSADIRKQLVEVFSSELVAETFKLPDLVFGSFVAEIGYRRKFNALDVQLAALAVLEDPEVGKSNDDKFFDAVQVLNVHDSEAFQRGVDKAKVMLKLLLSQVQRMIEEKQMQEMGPFIVVQLPENLLEFNFFKRPASLPLLTHFLQFAGLRSGSHTKFKRHPWIFMIPDTPQNFVAVGVQAGAYEEPGKSQFGEVFRVIQKRLGEENMELDFFDEWAARVKTSERQKFIDALLSVSDEN